MVEEVILMISELITLILIITLLIKYIKTVREVRKFKYEAAMADFHHRKRMADAALKEQERRFERDSDKWMRIRKAEMAEEMKMWEAEAAEEESNQHQTVNITPKTKQITGEDNGKEEQYGNR